MEGKGASRDLLELEHKNQSSPFSSAIDSALLIGKEKKKKKREEQAPPSKPTIAPVPKSEFLDKAKSFLGVMAEANRKLEQETEEGNSFDIEALTGNESQVIEMDLMLGVADLNTPEAVRAAEAAIAGNGVVNGSGGDSSSDESDGDEDDDDGDVKMSSKGEEGGRKQTKIVELS